MTAWNDLRAKDALNRIFMAAVASADPAKVLQHHLPSPPKGRCVVVGAGKASAAMAAALDKAWADVNLSGIVVTRYGHAVPAGRIEIIEASHPVPDDMSAEAARRILAAVEGLTADDMVIALISGGGSALMVAPAQGVTLADKMAVNRALLASGATISEMNAVRKHLSRIKGGRLALAAKPARVVSLLISDVPGDDPSEIASGPTVADPSDINNVREIVSRYALDLPENVRKVLEKGEETPKAGDIEEDIRLIATPSLALQAAADEAVKLGLTPLILGDSLEGESKDVGAVMAGIALSASRKGLPVKGPAVLLSGGETTVTIGKGLAGKGGRNTEFLLSLALTLKGAGGIWAIAGDSDGIDGVEDAAGALVTPDTLARMRNAGADPRQSLVGHDSYTAFKAVGDLVVTGPTLTNVNDIRAILIG
ncbi:MULTISPECIES: glycerate kinase type-2 family protein [Rhizobium/Agrobacterium group]|uniref:glycerate kinase type-2 family protein n=1 Tax=Rhizobium/Agrobacterium group TaxID=227290 RepID=UPI0003F1F05E|nr:MULTISPECIES: glycerate kinase [Rhizobium/Agrobacterium group]AHK03061.1 D-glycerate 2-kinase [Agrobacterium tumefaciens LBA4213 (Ach5)]AKC08851.1 hydroxypyruvate reductase [Agrobacterium tumefaciens]AYM17993.1 hydroxypyruvate reductase [Agrobacterium tumefaciens]AYM69292.1 hydroxypyruvate reductase [Agrobacterium tumefaciens]NIB55789.1 glycerate kinase [Agrobacterium tumefaciens]